MPNDADRERIKHCLLPGGCSINPPLYKQKSGRAKDTPAASAPSPGIPGRWPALWPFACVSLALGFTFATGPFRAPDEPHHFFRAYEVSEGRLIATRPGGGFLGDWLPQSVDKTAQVLGAQPNVPPVQVAPGAMAAAWKIQLKSHHSFVLFPGAALHSPFVYAPAALAISLGKIWHARPLLLFYLARCANAIVAGCLIGLALNRIWRRAPYLVTLALLPMCISQVGTLTSDALTFGLVFFWFAEILHARGESGSDPPRWRWILLAAALSQLRFPYPLLGLLIFAVPFSRWGRTRVARLWFSALFFGVLILPALLWIGIVQGLRVPMRPLVEVDPAAQFQFIVSHPWPFIRSIVATLQQDGYEYWRQTIGVFGWLNLPAPTWILVGVSLSLVVTICSSESRLLRLTTSVRLAWFALGAAGLVLTAAVVYLAWNSVGAPRIDGWQGRYAIPVLPLLATALANGSLRRRRWLGESALAFSVLANLASILYVARATWF